MKHIIFLSMFFCFASFSAVAFDFDGGAQLPSSRAFDSGDNSLFGSQSSGSAVTNNIQSGGGYSNGSSTNSSTNIFSDAFDWLVRQTSSAYSSPLQRAIGGEPGDNSGFGDPNAGTENPNDHNDVPVGGGAGIMFAFSLVYLAFTYRKRKVQA